jgi:ATP-binding cassette subfamily B multidrug efflux pump
MLAFFENLVDPFPSAVPVQPPRSLFGFLWHYAKPVAPHLLFVSLTATAFAIMEVALFGFLGNLVDFFAETNRETFWSDHFWWMIGVGLLILVVFPLLEVIHQVVTHQGIMGNFPMRIRWLAHRYLLRQSMTFFEDDFAGRVATKVMQTALAVKEVVALSTEVFVYVTVYFMGALVLFAQRPGGSSIPIPISKRSNCSRTRPAKKTTPKSP